MMQNEAGTTDLLWSLIPHLQPQTCPFAGPEQGDAGGCSIAGSVLRQEGAR